MSDIHNEEGSYLTTDAVPDKPRKNVPAVIISEDKADRSEENKSVPSSPVHTTKPKPRSSPTASNRTSKPKKKPCSSPRSTHATAKVINVVQSHGVHVGTVNNYNLYSNIGKPKQEKPNETIYRTEEIDQILANNNAVTTEHINFISTHLGEEWRAVGKNLGYSKGQMDHFYADNKDTGVKEVVYQMLLDWIRMNPEESKIRDLARILWDTDQKEVVQRWTKIL